MAGANSKTFKLINGVTVPMLGEGVVAFLRTEKGMIAEGAAAPEGYFVQAKTESDGWKSISGMTKATQVQFIAAGDMVVVNVGSGNWSDKVGAGVVGALLFAPLAVTATIGAVGQTRLAGEILDYCEKYILAGGVSIVVGATPASSGKVTCKQCGSPTRMVRNSAAIAAANLARPVRSAELRLQMGRSSVRAAEQMFIP